MRKEKGARTPAIPRSRSKKPFLTKGTRMNTPLQHPQTEGKRFCPGCGSQLKPEAKFCTHCGKQLGDRLTTSTPAEKKFSIEKLPIDLQKGKELSESSESCGSYTYLELR